MKIISDQHLHTSFSTDSTADPRSVAEAAINQGLSHICFTDHYDIDSPFDGEYMFPIDVYLSAMRKVAEEFRGRLHVGIGVEIGLMPGKEEKAEEVAQAAPFDLIIGSVHYIDNKDPYYREEFAAYTDAALYHRYFEEVLASIRETTCFHTLGHLDYVVRYGRKKAEEYQVSESAEVIDEILRRIISCRIALEVNSCGFRSGLGFPNPHPEILRRYREMGGELITLGSDAHRPGDVAADFADLQQLLLDTGFRHYALYEGGVPAMQPLD